MVDSLGTWIDRPQRIDPLHVTIDRAIVLARDLHADHGDLNDAIAFVLFEASGLYVDAGDDRHHADSSRSASRSSSSESSSMNTTPSTSGTSRFDGAAVFGDS